MNDFAEALTEDETSSNTVAIAAIAVTAVAAVAAVGAAFRFRKADTDSLDTPPVELVK